MRCKCTRIFDQSTAMASEAPPLPPSMLNFCSSTAALSSSAILLCSSSIEICSSSTTCKRRANCFFLSSKVLMHATFSASKSAISFSRSAISFSVSDRGGCKDIIFRIASHSSLCCLSILLFSSCFLRSSISV
uniref:Ngg1 interacting factor 3 like 1 binding protein 1 n=1 Tax=Arundo donax TaxID=35708 RepID=A0A0A9G838_ARUDO